MPWIYLSPHLDDAVFSCGGLIYRQTQAGEPVEIWTLCAGDPPEARFSPFAQELHARWGALDETVPGSPAAAGSVAHRREEDRAACAILGARPRHFPLPDCIYRRPGLDYWSGAPPAPAAAPDFLYPDRESIFGTLHPQEEALVEQVAAHLAAVLPGDARLVAPLTLGQHVDHQLTRRVAARLAPTPAYYADFPYAAEHFDELDRHVPAGWRQQVYPLTEAELEAWTAASAAHRSQISSFWPNRLALRQALADYSRRLGGAALWLAAVD